MKKLILPLLVIALLIGACTKDNNSSSGSNKKMDELNISSSFDYKNTKDIPVKIVLPKTIDFSNLKSRIEIYSASDSEDGKLLYTVSANNEGVFEGTLTFPSYLESIYVKTIAGNAEISLANSYKYLFKDGGINYVFGENYDTLPPQIPTKALQLKNTDPLTSAKPGIIVKNKVVVANRVENGDFEINNFGSINTWSSPMQANGKWYKTDMLRSSVEWKQQSGNHFLRTTGYSYLCGGVAQLITAQPGEEITFSADVKLTGNRDKIVWLYLIPRNANGYSLNYYNVSTSFVNNEWQNLTIAATMPSGTAYVQVLFWEWNFGGTIDIDNAFVYGTGILDSDNDGVPDDQDEFPNDAQRAFNIYYPSQNYYGTYAFEDNWPGRGDYDFNDLVIGYQYHYITNAYNNMVELFANFSVKAIGASFENGFGFQIDYSPSEIASVDGLTLNHNYISLNGNNTEAGQDLATIIVFDNAFDILPSPGGGTGVNTTPGLTYVTPDTLTAHVLLNTSSLKSTKVATITQNFNPFLIINEDRGREVHLPDYQPTSLASSSYFGTLDDDSDPLNLRYYKTEQNLPWGIDIPDVFAYPNEKTEITQAHLHFVEWAESAGTSYTDWYLNKNGYRNDNNIYSVPTR